MQSVQFCVIIYWNLENGQFTMQNGIMNVSGKVVFKAEEYTQEDLTIVRDLILGNIETTTEHLAKYDFTGKGYIESLDYVKTSKLVNKDVEQYTLDIFVQINGLSQNNIIKTGGVSIGMNGIYTKHLTAGRINITELRTLNEGGIEVVGTSGYFQTADGKTVNVANGIITGII